MKSKISWIAGLCIVAALIIAGIWYESWYQSQPGKYDAFASCLAQSGVKFYGAFWCPHCHDQKDLFGKSASKLPYVECSTADGNSQTQVCIDNRISEYPTWTTKTGSTTVGVLSFDQLSELSGCPVPQR